VRAPLVVPLLVLVCACRAQTPDRGAELGAGAPDAWQAESTANTLVIDRWWERFGDPELTAAIEEALAHNRDLAASAARVEAARALAEIAGAGRRPQLGLNASAARRKQIFVGLPLPGGGPLESTSENYGVSLDLSWELDLWGRLKAARNAADADLAASAEDHEAARQSLVAQTAKAWFAWQAARMQEEMLERSAASFERSAGTIEERYQSGVGSALDVQLSKSNASSARARLEAVREQVEGTQRQLEILLGRYPAGTLEGRASLPEPGEGPPAGLPAEILDRRPDLRAARARLEATDHRLAEARAQLYPSLSLTASGGRTSDALGDLLDSDFDVWSLMGNLMQPIFQGGRLAAGVDLAEARVEEALAGFAATLLRAFAEVEGALAVEESLALREGWQLRAADEAAAASRLAEERYLSGLVDLITLLEAQRRALDAESQWIDARQSRLESRVDLHLALGGGFDAWSADEETQQP
jgi:NodT family efflux transporter outer membrane factor (OMF) lipoprotein